MPFLLAILLFLSSTAELFSTAVSLEILIGPNNTLLFLIGEHHALPNPNPGGNEAVIQKLLTILRKAEERPDGGYRLFIESCADQIFETSDDLLKHIIVERDTLAKSSFEDIEQLRSVSMGVRDIFMYPTPFTFSLPFRDSTPSSAEKDAEFRKKCLNRYRCDLNTITFDDLFELYEKQLECLRNKKNEWPRPLHYLLATRLKAIEWDVDVLRAVLARFKIISSESIITEAIRLYRKGGAVYMHGKIIDGGPVFEPAVNLQIKLTIDSVNNGIFNLQLLDRILQACSEDSSKPMIVIAGDGHIRELTIGFKDLGFTPLHTIREQIDTSTYDKPINPEVLDTIEQPQELFLAAQRKVAEERSWYPCLLL